MGFLVLFSRLGPLPGHREPDPEPLPLTAPARTPPAHLLHSAANGPGRPGGLPWWPMSGRSILVVEDEEAIAEAVRVAPGQRGLRGSRRRRRARGAPPRRRRAARPGGARPDAPGHGRPGGVPRAPARLVGPGADAHRPGRRGRQGGGPRGRRRRLHDQAVQPSRAGGAGAGDPSPDGADAPGVRTASRCERFDLLDRHGAPAGDQERRGGRAHAARVRDPAPPSRASPAW